MAGGRPAPGVHRGNHLEIPCQACFLLVTLTSETDFQMELRQKAVQLLRNTLIINAWCWLPAMYTRPLSIHFHSFSNKSMDDTYKSYNERKWRSSMYSQMVILWKRGYGVCLFIICVCSYYVCVCSLKKQRKEHLSKCKS